MLTALLKSGNLLQVDSLIDFRQSKESLIEGANRLAYGREAKSDGHLERQETGKADLTSEWGRFQLNSSVT